MRNVHNFQGNVLKTGSCGLRLFSCQPNCSTTSNSVSVSLTRPAQRASQNQSDPIYCCIYMDLYVCLCYITKGKSMTYNYKMSNISATTKLKLRGPNPNDYDLLRKTTSKYKIQISQPELSNSYSKLKLKLRESNKSLQRFQIKTACFGRGPLNIKCHISQKLLTFVSSAANLRLISC